MSCGPGDGWSIIGVNLSASVELRGAVVWHIVLRAHCPLFVGIVCSFFCCPPPPLCVLCSFLVSYCTFVVDLDRVGVYICTLYISTMDLDRRHHPHRLHAVQGPVERWLWGASAVLAPSEGCSSLAEVGIARAEHCTREGSASSQHCEQRVCEGLGCSC